MDSIQISEIKRFLRLSEIALKKVKFNHNGTKIINPMQQASATRLYKKAYSLKLDISIDEFIKIHKEVIAEMENMIPEGSISDVSDNSKFIAVDFAKWIADNKWYKQMKYDIWEKSGVVSKSTSELFDMFTKEQNQPRN